MQTQTQGKNGCFNRTLVTETLVQDGYKEVSVGEEAVRVANYIKIPYRMSTQCHYDLRSTDSKCHGCKHQ